MFKKILSIVLAVAMIASLCAIFAACDNGDDELKGMRILIAIKIQL